MMCIYIYILYITRTESRRQVKFFLFSKHPVEPPDAEPRLLPPPLSSIKVMCLSKIYQFTSAAKHRN